MQIITVLFLAAMVWCCCAEDDSISPGLENGVKRKHRIKDGDHFDYIVVGAGAAGAPLAARLALAGSDVLLLEAGGDPGLLSKIPEAAMTLMGSDVDWFYETIPNNKSCLSARGRQCRFSRGRCLGGSTSINYMLHTRGNRHDYDFNLPGWSWTDLQPYLLRYEGLHSHLPASSAPYHNTRGPVGISYFNPPYNPWHQRIVKGLRDLHFPHNPDVDAESQIGVTRSLGYTSKGERVSTNTAYLEKRDVRKQLKIAKFTRCTGVIVDGNRRAYGVTAIDLNDNTTLRLFVTREVILSAGTVGTAQLLLLSGIGPASHLQQLGIPVRVNLPVGEGMSDHVLPIVIIKVDQVSDASPNLYLIGEKGIDAAQWLTLRSGPFASIGVTDILGFANMDCYDFNARALKNGSPQCTLPTIQMIFRYIDRYSINFVPDAIHKFFNADVVKQMLAANQNSSLLIASPILLKPKSRGWIRLASANPLAPPAIMPNYLDDEKDVEDMVKSIKIIEQLLETPVFRQYRASFLRLQLQGCPEFGEVSYWECYIRHMTSSVHHAVGTAALGRVVDERLRVRGVKMLRVADASVLPTLPRGNTAAAAIAIGERLSDFLLQDNSLG